MRVQNRTQQVTACVTLGEVSRAAVGRDLRGRQCDNQSFVSCGDCDRSEKTRQCRLIRCGIGAVAAGNARR